MKKAEWENWTNLLLGAWLFLTPWLITGGSLSTSVVSSSNWNAWIVGTLVFSTAVIALQDLKPWEEWTNLVLGAWMVLSPWMFGYANQVSLMWNSVIVGLAVAVFSGIALPVATKLQRQRV